MEQQTSPDQASNAPTQYPSAGGLIILQWLTYAFWGWLILGLTWLLATILINAIVGTSVSSAIPYAIAATIVILPIASVCDFFYRRHEPAKKVGGAMVIMVIHAVIFALLAIGSLVGAVFAVLSTMLTIDTDSKGAIVAALTAGSASILYIAALLRTLNPRGKKLIPRIYGYAMLGITLLMFVFAITGPILSSISTRDDRRIEASLGSIKQNIDQYIDDNNALPASLNTLSLTNDTARALVAENKVRYIAEGKKVVTINNLTDLKGVVDSTNTPPTFRYQLCVTYRAAGTNSYGVEPATSSDNQYQAYLYPENHPAGDVCYKLEFTTYKY